MDLKEAGLEPAVFQLPKKYCYPKPYLWQENFRLQCAASGLIIYDMKTHGFSEGREEK